ncbi:MAG: helix-turn-helix transcriptional regulator [Planctomycetota bacterium]
MRGDLTHSWRIADVARELGTSARSLQRALAAEGLRYVEVVDRVRNDEAARLLDDSQLSITEIGLVTGFSDSAHFSRSFRRRFGTTPSAYRSRARSGGSERVNG